MTNTPIQASGSTIRDILAEVRRQKKWLLGNSREILRSGGEDGLYRIHLSNGAIIEATVIAHSRCEVHS